MCKYCESDNVIMKKDINVVRGIGPVGQGGYIDDDVLMLIYDDRGYLRLVNEDYGCLDHGEKIKVNFCFHCGRRIQ